MKQRLAVKDKICIIPSFCFFIIEVITLVYVTFSDMDFTGILDVILENIFFIGSVIFFFAWIFCTPFTIATALRLYKNIRAKNKRATIYLIIALVINILILFSCIRFWDFFSAHA